MEMEKTIALACDHGGFLLKEEIKKHLDGLKIKYIDYGCDSTESVDYPVYADKLCRGINDEKAELGILVCGTGIGMSIAANKHSGIRAACCSDTFCARMTRMHNNANVLCLGGRVVGTGLALDIVDIFLDTEFEGGRHIKRVEMLTELDKVKK